MLVWALSSAAVTVCSIPLCTKSCSWQYRSRYKVHCLVMSSEIRILQVQSVEFRILWKVHLSSYTGWVCCYCLCEKWFCINDRNSSQYHASVEPLLWEASTRSSLVVTGGLAKREDRKTRADYNWKPDGLWLETKRTFYSNDWAERKLYFLITIYFLVNDLKMYKYSAKTLGIYSSEKQCF